MAGIRSIRLRMFIPNPGDIIAHIKHDFDVWLTLTVKYKLIQKTKLISDTLSGNSSYWVNQRLLNFSRSHQKSAQTNLVASFSRLVKMSNYFSIQSTFNGGNTHFSQSVKFFFFYKYIKSRINHFLTKVASLFDQNTEIKIFNNNFVNNNRPDKKQSMSKKQ